MKKAHIFFSGVALLSTAAFFEGGFEPSLWVAGGLLVLYAFARAVVET
jgi:hypothetical protein